MSKTTWILPFDLSDLDAYAATPPELKVIFTRAKAAHVKELHERADALDQITWLEYMAGRAAHDAPVAFDDSSPDWSMIRDLAERLVPSLSRTSRVRFRADPWKSPGFWRLDVIDEYHSSERYTTTDDIYRAARAIGLWDVTCRYCGAVSKENVPACDCAERIACRHAGELLHQCCGWCVDHAQPRFQCPATCWHCPQKAHDRPLL